MTDLFTEWEDKLRAEGLGARGRETAPWTDGALLASLAPHIIEVATEAAKFEGPDHQEVLALDELLYWLPERDQETVRLWRQGLTQRAIGAHLGIAQSSVSNRLRKATRRLRALHEVKGLPRDREAVREAVLASWNRGSSIILESFVADFFFHYTRTWSGDRAAQIAGISQSSAWTWTQQLIQRDRNKLPVGIDEGVRQLVSVIEELPSSLLPITR